MFLVRTLPSNDFKVDRTGSISTQIYAFVQYHGHQVYIYKSLTSSMNNLIYYYVPIMIPKVKSNDSWIWTSGKGELRLHVMFGNDEIETLVRKEIVKTGENGTFQVALLIIDSFSVFITNANNKPIPGVYPFRKTHPNEKTMTIRFQCSSEDIAQEVMSHVIDGDYDVEFVFFFAGFYKISMSRVPITKDLLKNVLIKTTADGGNTKAIYIHRNQADKFISTYLSNVRKMIYKEDLKSNTSLVTTGLEETLFSLIQRS